MSNFLLFCVKNMNFVKKKAQKVLLQRAWQEALRIEEMRPLVFILFNFRLGLATTKEYIFLKLK
jgi:hypothetical protein